MLYCILPWLRSDSRTLNQPKHWSSTVVVTTPGAVWPGMPLGVSGVWVMATYLNIPHLINVTIAGVVTGMASAFHRLRETAMVNVKYKSDRAVVPVTGVIEEEMMLPLVAIIQQLYSEYFFIHIELEVCSPGGQARALDYLVEAMDTLRAQGVVFTTRALMSVSSAAANLVSLGDHREALRSATFLYHQARTLSGEAVTAQSARQILSAVDKIDERYLTRLVGRARCGERRRPVLTVRDFADNDWPIMEYLLISAGVVQTQPGGAKPARKTLLQRLRKHVAACLRAQDDRPFKRLYRHLLELDRYISAALALELQLIDVVNDVSACEPQKTLPDHLCIPEWGPLFRPHGRLHRNTLCRHTLVLGETGSGKTVSGILPVVGSIMAPENRMVGCTLVIDPKREIRDVIQQLQHPDIAVHDIDVEQTERRPVLNLMAGYGQSLAPALADDQFMEAARQILIRSASLSPLGAARAMTDGRVDDRDIYWAGEGARLAQTALGLALLIIRYRQRIYGDSETPGLIGNADPEARSLLAVFGMEAGWLEECEDIKALVMRTKSELRDIRHLWIEFEQQKEREERMAEEAEEAEKRRRWGADRERAEVESHAQGAFVRQKRILIPVTVAELDEAKAKQDKDDDAPEKPATQTSAVTLYNRWQKALMPVMQRFAEAGRGAALYRTSQRFRDVFEMNIEKAALDTDYDRIRDEVLVCIGQAALHPLDDSSIRPAPNILALAQTVLQSFFKASRRDSGSNKKKTVGLSNTEDIPAMTVVELLKEEIQSGQAATIYQVIEQSWNPHGQGGSAGPVRGSIRLCPDLLCGILGQDPGLDAVLRLRAVLPQRHGT